MKNSIYFNKQIDWKRSFKNVDCIIISFCFIFAICIFIKNIWVSEDAFIIFRSIEQLFAGRGPIWNPHERVQVFTSPLWYMILSCVRFFSNDHYLNVVIISLVFWVFTLIIINKIFKNAISFFLAVLFFVVSNAFYDYTSSGLENILGYFFLAIFFLIYLKLIEIESASVKSKLYIYILCFLSGLSLLIRHDYLFFFSFLLLFIF